MPRITQNLPVKTRWEVIRPLGLVSSTVENYLHSPDDSRGVLIRVKVTDASIDCSFHVNIITRTALGDVITLHSGQSDVLSTATTKLFSINDSGGKFEYVLDHDIEAPLLREWGIQLNRTSGSMTVAIELCYV